MPSKGAEWRPRSRRWRPRSRRINALLSSMTPETSQLGVTTVRGGGGASLRAQDQGLGHGHGGLFTTLNTQAKFYSSFFTSTTAGTRPGSRVTATTTSSAASPHSLEDIKSTIVISIYSCNVPQDRIMGGRECSDIISLCSRVKSRDLSGHNAQYLSLITS